MANSRPRRPRNRALMDIEDITVLDQQETPVQVYTKGEVEAALRPLLAAAKQRTTRNSRGHGGNSPTMNKQPAPLSTSTTSSRSSSAPTRTDTGAKQVASSGTNSLHTSGSATTTKRNITPPTSTRNTALSPTSTHSPFLKNIPVMQPKGPTDEQIKRVQEMSTAQKYMSISKGVVAKSPKKSTSFGSQGETVVPLDDDDIIKRPGRTRPVIQQDDEEEESDSNHNAEKSEHLPEPDNDDNSTDDSVEFLGQETISLSEDSSDEEEPRPRSRKRRAPVGFKEAAYELESSALESDDSAALESEDDAEIYRQLKSSDNYFIIDDDDDIILSDTDGAYGALNKAISEPTQVKPNKKQALTAAERAKEDRNRDSSEKSRRRREIEKKKRENRDKQRQESAAYPVNSKLPKANSTSGSSRPGSSEAATLGPSPHLPESSTMDPLHLNKNRPKKLDAETQNQDTESSSMLLQDAVRLAVHNLSKPRKVSSNPPTSNSSTGSTSLLTKAGSRKLANQSNSSTPAHPQAHPPVSYMPSFIPTPKLANVTIARDPRRKPTMNNPSSAGAVAVGSDVVKQKVRFGNHVEHFPTDSHAPQKESVKPVTNAATLNKGEKTSRSGDGEKKNSKTSSMDAPRLPRKESMSSLERPKVTKSAPATEPPKSKWHGAPPVRRVSSSTSSIVPQTQHPLPPNVPRVNVSNAKDDLTSTMQMVESIAASRLPTTNGSQKPAQVPPNVEKVVAMQKKKRPESNLFLESASMKKRKLGEYKGKYQQKDGIAKELNSAQGGEDDSDLDYLFEASQSDINKSVDPIQDSQQAPKPVSSQILPDSLDSLFEHSLPTPTHKPLATSAVTQAPKTTTSSQGSDAPLASLPPRSSPDIPLASLSQALPSKRPDATTAVTSKKPDVSTHRSTGITDHAIPISDQPRPSKKNQVSVPSKKSRKKQPISSISKPTAQKKPVSAHSKTVTQKKPVSAPSKTPVQKNPVLNPSNPTAQKNPVSAPSAMTTLKKNAFTEVETARQPTSGTDSTKVPSRPVTPPSVRSHVAPRPSLAKAQDMQVPVTVANVAVPVPMKTSTSAFSLDFDDEEEDSPLVDTNDLDGIMKQLNGPLGRFVDEELNSKNNSSHSDLSQMTPVSNGVSPINSPDSLSTGVSLKATEKPAEAVVVDLTDSTAENSDKSMTDDVSPKKKVDGPVKITGDLSPKKKDGPPKITGSLSLKPAPPVPVEPVVPIWRDSTLSKRPYKTQRRPSLSDESDTEIVGSPIKLRSRSPMSGAPKSKLFVPADSDDESQIIPHGEQALQELSDSDDSGSDVEMMTEAEYFRATQRS